MAKELEQPQVKGVRNRRRTGINIAIPLLTNTYNQVAVKGLFALFLMITVFVHLDFGIFAAASLQIKESLGLDNLRFGALQSMVFFGIIAGKNLMILNTSCFL